MATTIFRNDQNDQNDHGISHPRNRQYFPVIGSNLLKLLKQSEKLCQTELLPWRPAGGLEAFGGFEAGQTAVLNPLKNRWQGHVVATV